MNHLAFGPGQARVIGQRCVAPAREQRHLDRFKREVRATSTLAHPNIVNIYEVAYDEYFVCLIMEFVQGQTLNAYIRGRPLLSTRYR